MSDNLFLAPCFGDLSASQESNDSVALARQQMLPDKQSQTSISPLPDIASPIDAPNSPSIISEPLPSTICVDFATTDLENASGELSALAEPPINAFSSPILENSTPLPSAQSSQVLYVLDKVDDLEHFDEELPKNDQDCTLPDEQLPFELTSESTPSSPTECATNPIDFDASLSDELSFAGANLYDDRIRHTPQPESSDNTAEINSLDDRAPFIDETVLNSSSTLDQDYVSSSPTSCPSDSFCFSSSPSLVSTATVPTSDMIIKDDEQEEEEEAEELDLVAPTDIQLDNDCLPPSSPQISSSPPRILLDQEEEISEPERLSLPDALLLSPEHEVSSDFDIQAVYTSSNEDEPLPSSPDRNFLPSHDFHISPPAATSPERLNTSRMVSLSSPPRPASKAQPSSPIMHQSSPIRLSSKQTMPTPKRPTALNHKRQFKKLSAPFRAPQMKLQERSSSPVPLPLKQQKEESSDGQLMLPPPPPQDVKKRHRTIRASGQFRSPMVGASSIPSGPSVRMTPTIQLLERQVQILKRAVKVKNGGEEEELERLAKKWTEGGREVAWELWEAVKDNGSGSGSWDQPKSKRSFKDSWGWVEQGDGKKPKTENWGWDEKPEGDDNEEKQAASTGDDEGDEKVEFTMGLMLRQFGIDPETLGWNEEDGMFADL